MEITFEMTSFSEVFTALRAFLYNICSVYLYRFPPHLQDKGQPLLLYVLKKDKKHCLQRGEMPFIGSVALSSEKPGYEFLLHYLLFMRLQAFYSLRGCAPNSYIKILIPKGHGI